MLPLVRYYDVAHLTFDVIMVWLSYSKSIRVEPIKFNLGCLLGPKPFPLSPKCRLFACLNEYFGLCKRGLRLFFIPKLPRLVKDLWRC